LQYLSDVEVEDAQNTKPNKKLHDVPWKKRRRKKNAKIKELKMASCIGIVWVSYLKRM